MRFKTSTPTAARRRVLSGLREAPALDLVSARDDVLRVFDPGREDPDVLAEPLARQPEVDFVQPNYVRRMPRVSAANPSLSSSTRAAERRLNDGRAAASNADGPLVAVIGTGITTSTSVVGGRLWIGQVFEDVSMPARVSPALMGVSFVRPWDAAAGATSELVDFGGEGTALVAAIVEHTGPVRIMPVRVCRSYWDLMLRRGANSIDGFLPETAGGCVDSDIVAGIAYAAESGANVIAIALPGVWPSPAVQRAITNAAAGGSVVVVATVPTETLTEASARQPALDGVVVVGALQASRAASITLSPLGVSPSETSVPRFDQYVSVARSSAHAAVSQVTAAAVALLSGGPIAPPAIEHALRAALAGSDAVVVVQ